MGGTHLGAGVEGAAVSACILSSPSAIACDSDRDTVQHAVTDDVGAYRMAGIPDGQYTIMPPVAEGFFPAKFGPTPSMRVSGDTRLASVPAGGSLWVFALAPQ